MFLLAVRVWHFNYLLRVWPAFACRRHLAAAAHAVGSPGEAVLIRGSFACPSDSMKKTVCCGAILMELAPHLHNNLHKNLIDF
jgi:hypothetical protein